MYTIIIKVGKDKPEDDILNLVDTFKALFSDEILNISDALVIETDIKPAAEIFQKIAGMPVKESMNGKGKKYTCVECGLPVTKEGGRCKKHAMQLVAKNKASKAKLSTGEQNDLEMAEFMTAVDAE